MKKTLLLLAVLLASCGPMYKTVKDYHLPERTPTVSTCSNICLHNRSTCQTQCERTKHDCSALDERKANNEYTDYLRRHCSEVSSTQYLSSTNQKTTKSRISCDTSKTLKDFRNPWDCTSNNDKCKNDCETIYDSCFTGCGGWIEKREVCVFNCDNATE